MAELHPQTFATDKILAKLVAYFNALPAAQRTIQFNDLPLFKVQIIDNGAGEEIIIGPTSKVEAGKFLGEVVYLWVGGAGPNKVATSKSFFEVSKFLNPTTPVNVRHDVSSYIGDARWADDEDRLYKEQTEGPCRVLIYMQTSSVNHPIDPAGGVVTISLRNYNGEWAYTMKGPNRPGKYLEFNVIDGTRVEVRYENIAVGSILNVSTYGPYSPETIIVTQGKVEKSSGYIAFATSGGQPE